jgi:hypothetical protein
MKPTATGWSLHTEVTSTEREASRSLEGRRSKRSAESFFMLERYHSTRDAVRYRSVENDVYGP